MIDAHFAKRNSTAPKACQILPIFIHLPDLGRTIFFQVAAVSYTRSTTRARVSLSLFSSFTGS